MLYTVRQFKKMSAPFSDYRYGIYQNEKLIAYFWHDYRGDDNGIEFVNGLSVPDPVDRMTNFLKSGGEQPLTLTKQAIQYINENRPQ